MKQTISILVENQAGVLNRITGLFSRRAFNIESLAVGVTDDPSISRITIIVDSGNSVVEQVEKQLNKLVDIMNVCQIMGAKSADISPTTMTLEISDTADRLELFQSLLRPFSILEVARTGLIAVQKGSGKM